MGPLEISVVELPKKIKGLKLIKPFSVRIEPSDLGENRSFYAFEIEGFGLDSFGIGSSKKLAINDLVEKLIKKYKAPQNHSRLNAEKRLDDYFQIIK